MSAPQLNLQNLIERPPEGVRHKHLAIIDTLVAHPELEHYKVAKLHGITGSHLCQLMKSDLFQMELQNRREASFSTAMAETADQIDALAKISLDRLIERMEQEADSDKISRAAELALRASGYIRTGSGGTISSTNQTNITLIGSIDKKTLEAARAAARLRYAASARAEDSEVPEPLLVEEDKQT